MKRSFKNKKRPTDKNISNLTNNKNIVKICSIRAKILFLIDKI